MKTNIKYPILIFLLFHFPSLLAQNLILPDSVQLGQEGYESLYKLLYSKKEYFKQQQCPVTKKPFDKGGILQEDIAGSNGGLENFSPEIDSSSISTILLFGQGKIELGFQLKIFVFDNRPLPTIEESSKIYPYANGDIKLEVLEWSIFTHDEGKRFNLQPLKLLSSSNGGGIHSNDFVDNSLEKRLTRIVSKTYGLGEDNYVNNIHDIKGSAQVKASYMKNYNTIEISKESVGDTLSFEGSRFVIVDVINKTIFYKIIENTKDLLFNSRPSEIRRMNLDLDRSHIFEAESKDETDSSNCPPKGFMSHDLIPIIVYQIFAKNPEITYKEFKAALPLTDKNFDLKSLEKSYSAYSISTPIERLVFYTPNYVHLKTFEAKMNEGNNSFGHLMNTTKFEFYENGVTSSRKK